MKLWVCRVDSSLASSASNPSRRRRPRRPVRTTTPGVSRGTSDSVLFPSASIGRLDQTEWLAWLAEVTQDFRASNPTPTTPSRAVETGAQKCKREPASAKASGLSCAPEAIVWCCSSLSAACTTASPQWCIVVTIAVLAQARAMRWTARAQGPTAPPVPPKAVGWPRPRSPVSRRAAIAAVGNAAPRSVVDARGWMTSRTTASTQSRVGESDRGTWLVLPVARLRQLRPSPATRLVSAELTGGGGRRPIG
jgi:hypothetical protein